MVGLPVGSGPPPLTFSRHAGSRASGRSRRVHPIGWAILCKETAQDAPPLPAPPSPKALGAQLSSRGRRFK